MKLTARCDSDGGPDEMAGIDEIAGCCCAHYQAIGNQHGQRQEDEHFHFEWQ